MARLTLRRLALITVTAGAVGAAALAAAVAIDLLSVTAALVLAFGGAVLAALGILGLGLRRIDTRVRSGLLVSRKQVAQIQKASEQSKRLAERFGRSVEEVTVQFAELRGAVTEDRVEFLGRLAQANERLEHANDQLEQANERLERLNGAVTGVEQVLEQLPARVTEPITGALDTANAKQVRLANRLYAKVEAQADLRNLVAPRAPMPSLSGWALDADIMHIIVVSLWEHRPELVVECGSGSSSVWFGYILERLGTGRVVALEHDERFVQLTQDWIRAHNLHEIVEVRHAPLQPWSDEAGGDEYMWYDVAALKDLSGIGLLLVDGPPGSTGSQARYPAGPVLIPRCSYDALVVLDDVSRSDEKAVSDRWLAGFPHLERTIHGHGAAHSFRRRPDNADGQVGV